MSIAMSIPERIAKYAALIDWNAFDAIPGYHQVWPVAALVDGRLKNLGVRWKYRRPWRLHVVSQALGREVTTFNDLHGAELYAVSQIFQAVSDADLLREVSAHYKEVDDLWVKN